MTILPPKGKRRSYYYDFHHQGSRYTKGGFRLWREADAAEAARKKELQKPPPSTPTATDFLTLSNEYLDQSQRRHVAKTYKGKTYVYKRFQAHVGNLPVHQINARIIEGYLATLPRDTNYNRHRKFLCAFFQWAFHRELIDKNPCLHVASLPTHRRRKFIYSREEMLKILMAAGKLRPFFLTLYALAGRLDEINRLRWEDVDCAGRLVSLWTRKGAGRWRRQVKPMNEDLYQELSRLYERYCGAADSPLNPFVFPNPATGQPYKNRRWQLHQTCQAAGVPNYGWHAIRHLALSLLAAGGIDLATIQGYAGHLSVHTTARYIQVVSANARIASELLSTQNPANDSRDSQKERVSLKANPL